MRPDYADTIYGNFGNDKIWGDSGDDTIWGGRGDDEIHGGPGNDWIDGQSEDDTISGDEGDDVIVGEGENDTVFGGLGNDLIYGSDGKDWLNGQQDQDTIYGEAEDDVLIGEDGNDKLIGGLDRDYMTGGKGDDVYLYTGKSEGVDWIRDGGDPERAREIDTIEAEGTDVWINMDEFSRELTGIEVIRGSGRAPAQVMGTDADDFLDFRDVALLGLTGLNGGPGDDTIHGSSSDDTIYGGLGLDSPDGGDKLYGYDGNDSITGGRGNDVIDGGAGHDSAIFWGTRGEFTITPLGDGRFTVVDRNAKNGDEGSDTLIAIDAAKFGNETVELADVSRNFRMSWWDEADAGMSVHWGPYAVPAGSWGDTDYCDTSEWLLMKEPEAPTMAEYEALASQLDGSRFDADAWASLAKQAGMDYLVFTAKHHDGFSMWPSAATDFDIADRTEFGKSTDPIGELARAAEERGLKFGLYYSILDLHHPALEPNESPAATIPSGPCPSSNDDSLVFKSFTDKAAYKAFMHEQLTELVTNYDPDILWFDGEWAGAGAPDDARWTEDDGAELVAFVRELSPDIVVNDRTGGPADYLTWEQDWKQGPDGWEKALKEPYPTADRWEGLITTNWNWGYNAKDDHWQSGEDLHGLLQDVNEHGGNLLINVGPTAAGEIPEPAVDSLLELGSLLAERAEAMAPTM